MTAQLNRMTAKAFAEANLCALAADVLAWHKNGVLPAESKMKELATLCVPFAIEGDEYQEAERIIVSFALQSAAGCLTANG
jgi:hypothetical protein